MNRTFRSAVTSLVFAGFMTIGAGVARAQDLPGCQPGVLPQFNAHVQTYTLLFNAIAPALGNINAQLLAVTNQPTYATLLATSRTVANSITNGRVLVALPDGTVVVDTGRPDDPANALPAGNSFAHFQAKTVNENHNSRIAILASQEYPCGFAVERKLSTTTGQTETYLGLRLGVHLDSNGTVRISNR